jgi:hypothetical protein
MINNTTISTFLDASAVGRASSSPFVDVFMTINPTEYDINYPTQKKWLNTSTGQWWSLEGFSSAGGVVTANWIKIGSGSILESVTGNTGGPVFPNVTSANNTINVVGDGVYIETTGNPSTNTLTISAVGGLTETYVANTGSAKADSGIINVLGGTDVSTSATGNTITINATGNVATTYDTNAGTATPASNILSVIGGTGITTSGSGSTVTINNTLPLGAFNSINVQVISTSGTYTPTPGMAWCQVQVLGGGGAGGGAPSTTPSTGAASGGGGAGEYAVGVFSAVTIGASQTVTIGAGGIGVSGANGGNGGTTSFGALITAGGGQGGIGGVSGNNAGVSGGVGGTGGTGGSYRSPGSNGTIGFFTIAFGEGVGIVISGAGASTIFGNGGFPGSLSPTLGSPAVGFGSGGGGSSAGGSGAASPGGNGVPGVVVVTEYIT